MESFDDMMVRLFGRRESRPYDQPEAPRRDPHFTGDDAQPAKIAVMDLEGPGPSWMGPYRPPNLLLGGEPYDYPRPSAIKQDIDQSGITVAPTPVPLKFPDMGGRGVLLPEDQPVQPVTLEARMPPPAVNPMQQMLEQQAGMMKLYGEQSQDIRQAQKDLLQYQQEQVRPAIKHIQDLAKSTPPEFPKFLQEPKAPSLQPRPFLSAEGQQGLMSIVAGLGSFVQSMFALSAPVYGLQALSGAMEGWAEGDNNRAQRQWHEYEGLVARMQRENKKALDTYEIARQSRFDDMQMLDANLQAKLHEAKLPEYALQFMQSGREQTAQQLNWMQQNIQHWQQMLHQKIQDDLNQARLQETERHNRESEKRMLSFVQPTEIVDPSDPKRTIKIDARTGKKIGDAPRFSEEGRFFRIQESGAKAYSTGIQGRQINAFGTAAAHLDTLRKLAKALDAGDTKRINQFKFWLQQELGVGQVPATFDALRPLIAGEIMKTVAASGGGVEERLQAAEAFNKALSPSTLDKVIDGEVDLLLGKINNLKAGYDVLQLDEVLGPFEGMISPEGRTLMKERGHGKTAPVPTSSMSDEELLNFYAGAEH